MDDARIIDRIEDLVREEQRLYERSEQVGLGESDHARLRELQAGLDDCWKALQRRRGRWEAGLDPGQEGDARTSG
jgi:hypothetical protein